MSKALLFGIMVEHNQALNYFVTCSIQVIVEKMSKENLNESLNNKIRRQTQAKLVLKIVLSAALFFYWFNLNSEFVQLENEKNTLQRTHFQISSDIVSLKANLTNRTISKVSSFNYLFATT